MVSDVVSGDTGQVVDDSGWRWVGLSRGRDPRAGARAWPWRGLSGGVGGIAWGGRSGGYPGDREDRKPGEAGGAEGWGERAPLARELELADGRVGRADTGGGVGLRGDAGGDMTGALGLTG